MKPFGDCRHLLPTPHFILCLLALGLGLSACRYQTGEIALPEYTVLFVPTPPAVQLDSVNARSLPARFYGAVTSQGSDTVTRYGFVFSASKAQPTVADSVVAVSGKPTQFLFSFQLSTAMLKRATRYYVRAFAENAQGISYNKDVVQFVVPDNRTLPGVALNAIENVAATSANAKATLTSDGNTPITAYGICYSTISANPTLSDQVLVTGTSVTGALPFGYAQVLSSLADNTTYYVRSFASNAIGTSYSSVVSFRTSAVATATPTIQTDNVVNITATTATTDGTLTSRGTAPVTRYGVCYSASNSNPTLADAFVVAGTTDPATLPLSFSAVLSGLTQSTAYYVRTFATNSAGTSYGATKTFRTVAAATAPPAVQTVNITNISYASASVLGNVTSGGTAPVTEYGIVYSAANATPTTADSKQIVGSAQPGSFPFAFTGNLSRLNANTTYAVRAYATNSVGTSYGAVQRFTTLIATPAVTTDRVVYSESGSSVTASGTIHSAGASAITRYGFCYSATNANPTLADNPTDVGTSAAGFPFAFSYSFKRLPVGTYYVRTYAGNGNGVAYGSPVSVQVYTSPAVTTDRSATKDNTAGIETLFGNISSGGSLAIQEYGFCYLPTASATRNFQVGDRNVTVVRKTTPVPSRFPFAFNLDVTVPQNTDYSFRAYVKTANGYRYGSISTFYINYKP